MKKFQIMFVLGLSLMLFLIEASAQENPLDKFNGTFINDKSQYYLPGDIGKIKLSVRGRSISAHVWKTDCEDNDSECDWGEKTANFYNETSTAQVVTVNYQMDYVEALLIIRATDADHLQVQAFIRIKMISESVSGGKVEESVSWEGGLSKYNFAREPGSENCFDYNPKDLKLLNINSNGYLLTDGRLRISKLDNEKDAVNALALAQQYTSHCFVGKNNKRENRADYIVEYWKGKSGQTTTISDEYCLSYNPKSLQITNEGAKGFLLTDGVSKMMLTDNLEDATAVKEIARNNSKHCYIGLKNTRPNRWSYVLEYWK